MPIVSLITNVVGTEGTPLQKNLAFSFADADGDKLMFQLNGLPKGSGLTINPESGVLAGVPTKSDISLDGPWPLRVTAVDGKGGFATGQFFLTVYAKNTPPEAKGIPPSVAKEGVSVSLSLYEYFVDPMGRGLIFSVVVSGRSAAHPTILTSCALHLFSQHDT